MSDELPTSLLIGGGSFLGSLVGYLVGLRWSKARPASTAEGGRALSVECWTRVLEGEQPGLRRRWRIGRTVVSRGRLAVSHFRWGVRLRPTTPWTVAITDVDRSGVHRAPWRTRVLREGTDAVATLTTATGARVQLALRAEDVHDVLDVLEGVPVPDADEVSEAPRVPPVTVSEEPRTTRVRGRVALDAEGRALHPGDAGAQLELCVDDVERTLAEVRLTLADVVRVVVRSTDAHAVTGQVGGLAARVRAAGADPGFAVLPVERLQAPGQVVELDVTAVG